MVKWLIDTSILEGRLNNKLPEIARAQGHEVFEVAFFKGSALPEIPFEDSDCVVVYGSHQFCRAVGVGRFNPGMFGLCDRTHVLKYLSNLPTEWFLNNQPTMTTWKLFTENKSLWYDFYKTDRIFIRPNSGFKTFAGQTLHRDEFEFEVNSMNQLTSVENETLMMIAPPKELLGEFRFVIADGQVLTGSEYRWDNKLDIRIDYPDECFDLAQKVASHPWQADFAYTCDVALTPDGPRVVELNSFSCAGMYACDLEKVVQGISATALKVWNGEASL